MIAPFFCLAYDSMVPIHAHVNQDKWWHLQPTALPLQKRLPHQINDIKLLGKPVAHLVHCPAFHLWPSEVISYHPHLTSSHPLSFRKPNSWPHPIPSAHIPCSLSTPEASHLSDESYRKYTLLSPRYPHSFSLNFLSFLVYGWFSLS